MDQGAENPAVAALRTLSIFGSDQAGAYREHYASVAAVLGADVETRLVLRTRQWASRGEPGLKVLTGNAGTGKTAVAEAFAKAAGAIGLPSTDDLVEVAPARWVLKDLSGLPDLAARVESLGQAIERAVDGQVLVCANEGVLRDTVGSLGERARKLAELIETALRVGAAAAASVLVVNLNRQRPTAPSLWPRLIEHLARAELWGPCPEDDQLGVCPYDFNTCPMRSNAEAIRRKSVQESLRTLVQLASGEAVPTLREVLAILAWAITAGLNCPLVKQKFRDSDRPAFDARQAYYALAFGAGLQPEDIERSPVLAGIIASGLGSVADLEVDDWLRDSTNAPEKIRELAGTPPRGETDSVDETTAGWKDSRSHLDRVFTSAGTKTFHKLGEMVATSEDTQKVNFGLRALVADAQPAQVLWRRRVFFEAPETLGGSADAAHRLISLAYFQELVDLAEKVATGRSTVEELTGIIQGLNFLVTGYGSANEGLIVPDPSCLFARNPGAFRPARPSLVHAQILRHRIVLQVPDRGLVADELDIDHIEVELRAVDTSGPVLRIRPKLYEAIREAALFQGPAAHGIAEMTDLRNFYGRLAALSGQTGTLRVTDARGDRHALSSVTLPELLNGD